MRSIRFRLLACLAPVLLAGVTSSLFAEISIDQRPQDQVAVLVLGIIEGPDPIPQVLWQPVRDIDPELILNPEGAVRGDGRPDITFDPATGWPHVVWAYANGTDHDIAYSRWNGSGWLEPEFLTSDTADQIDPRIHIDGETIYVVWCEAGPDAIWLTSRTGDGAWEPPDQVYTGMRPSVVTWGGTILVASERSDGQGGKEIFLSSSQGQGSFHTEPVNSNPVNVPLDVILHSEQGKLWMDWRRSADEFAYSEFDGADWRPPATVPWTDGSWVTIEEVRLVIRGIVLGSP